METIANKIFSISDELLDEFISLLESTRDQQFLIGDKLIEQVALYGYDKAQLINYIASQLNISGSLLHEYYRVSERWTREYRQMYQALDWTIYRNSDPLIDAELLNRAIDESWNSTRFKEEKYPALLEPSTMVARIRSIVKRFRFRDDEVRREVDILLLRLERILESGRESS